VLGNLTKYFFDPSLFSYYNECVICSEEFDKEAEVTPLPCNVKHYFHTACISHWLKENQSCPICRAPVTPEQLEVFQTQVKELLEQN